MNDLIRFCVWGPASRAQEISDLRARCRADPGLVVPVNDEQDPYAALDDLMAVIEALCTLWLERKVIVETGQMPL